MSFDEHEHDSANHGAGAGLVCWYCDRRFSVDHVLRDGILRARDVRHGGPYRLYICTICNRQNHCEKTRKGRWFSSPGFQPNLLDYILGIVIEQPKDFLKAASWLKENEERRRYFFERDGDRRHSTGGWLHRLWPLGAHADEPSRRPKQRAEDPTSSERPSADRGPAERPRPTIIGPWDILGVDREASAEEIRRAFHRLAVQYHPDKVHHMGEEFQVVAHEKFTELKNAYDSLMRRHSR
jgi:DnaJ like chaperone protein